MRISLIKKTLNSVKPVILLFLFWRIALFVVGYLGYFSLPNYPETLFYDNLHPVFSMWMPFDAGWYVRIAEEGYGFSTQAPAFFPLFPLVISAFKKILFFVDIDTRIIAFFVANLFTLGTCIFLYKLVIEQVKDKDIAYRSVKYLLLFPMGLFLATSYTEPAFLFFATSSFYYLARKKNVFAVVLASLAAVTRSVGVVMFVPIIFVLIKNLVKNKKYTLRTIAHIVLSLLIITMPLAYMFYLYTTQGDFLAFFHAQDSGGWGKTLGFGAINELFSHIKTLFSFHFFLPDGHYIYTFMRAGLLLIFLAITLIGVKKIPVRYTIYSVLVLIFPLAGGNLLSMNRFVMLAFPVFILLALSTKNKYIDDVISITMAVLLGLFTVMFVNGYWVG